MGYVDENLLQGESVVFRTRLSPLTFTGSILLGAVGLFLAIFGLSNKAVIGLSYLGAVVLVFALILALPGLIRFLSNEYAVTNKRVIIKVGVVRRNTLEMLLGKVEAISVSQSILGRIFNYGTITVVGTGGTKEPFKGIDQPLEFRKQVQAATVAS